MNPEQYKQALATLVNLHARAVADYATAQTDAEREVQRALMEGYNAQITQLQAARAAESSRLQALPTVSLRDYLASIVPVISSVPAVQDIQRAVRIATDTAELLRSSPNTLPEWARRQAIANAETLVTIGRNVYRAGYEEVGAAIEEIGLRLSIALQHLAQGFDAWWRAFWGVKPGEFATLAAVGLFVLALTPAGQAAVAIAPKLWAGTAVKLGTGYLRLGETGLRVAGKVAGGVL